MTAEELSMHIEVGDGVYWVRGHYDPSLFAAALAVDCMKAAPPIEEIRQRYWRIGKGDLFTDDYEYVYYVTKPGRGAFPVTVWEAAIP